MNFSPILAIAAGVYLETKDKRGFVGSGSWALRVP